MALKRGGGNDDVSLQTGGHDGEPLDVAADNSPGDADCLFDREWAETIVNRAVSILAAEYEAAGKKALFDALKPWLLGVDEDASRATMADRLGMSEGALKVALHRLRKRMREQVKAEIAQTVETEAEIRDEMRYLIDVLTRRP